MSSRHPTGTLVTPTSMTPSDHDLPASVQDEIARTTWLDFAAIILFLVGLFNIIDGIAAIGDSKYVAGQVLFSSTHTWGWFFLIWGVIQLVAAFAVYRGASWGVVLAIVTAFFNALAHLSAAKAAPIWSISIAIMDVLVIYGLVVHAGRPRQVKT